MQIGFAAKSSSFLNHVKSKKAIIYINLKIIYSFMPNRFKFLKQGCGIGDDQYSVAFDGCRQLVWYNGLHQTVKHPPWKEGDVIGFLLDIPNQKITFYINGKLINPVHTDIFRKVSKYN
jgi:hypothetical protein